MKWSFMPKCYLFFKQEWNELNLSDYVTVEYGDDMPVLLTWKTDDETAKVEYLLAPRIEEDV